MNRYYSYRWIWIVTGLAFLSMACGLGRGVETAIPAERAAEFEIQTATPTPDPSRGTVTLEAESSEQVDIASLGDAPTHTPDPAAPPTPLPLPTATPLALVSEATATQPAPTATTAELAPPTSEAVEPPPVELAPPLEGGDWDFEADFVPWPNPYGEPCPGASVASGWTAFVEDGPFGSSCMNENLYRPNIFSGAKSQEITFDFIAANSGIWRTIPTRPGHRYNIVAYAKNDFSVSPVEMFLGVDLTGGAVWNAETVEWFPWDNKAENTWNATEETVTATGEQMAVFIKGIHPLAEQGGKTVIDSVSVTDLGP